MPISRHRSLGRAALWLGVGAFAINQIAGMVTTLLISSTHFGIASAVSLFVGAFAAALGVTAIVLGAIAVVPRTESTAGGTSRVFGAIGLTAGAVVVLSLVDGLLRGVIFSL